MTEPSLIEELARHEAAHAVAAWALGRKIVHIHLDVHRGKGACRLERAYEEDCEGLPVGLSPTEAKAEATIRLIGHIVDGKPGFRLPPWPPGSVDDQTAAEKFADAAATSAREAEAILEMARQEATEMAAQPQFQRLHGKVTQWLASWPHSLKGDRIEDDLAFESELSRLPGPALHKGSYRVEMARTGLGRSPQLDLGKNFASGFLTPTLAGCGTTGTLAPGGNWAVAGGEGAGPHRERASCLTS